MKLVLATPLYPPEAGGPASYAKLLEDALPGHEWEVQVVKFSAVRHLPKIVRHVVYGYRVFKLARHADAVFALDPVSVGLPALIAARMARRPFFVKIVGDYAWEQGVQRFGITDTLDDFVTRKNIPRAVARLRAIETYVAKKAKRIIVPSRYLQKIILGWGIATEKISVVYNSPPLPLSHAKGERRIADPYIITIARLVPWKGISGLIRAFKDVHEQRPELKLVIVGDGPERERLTALTQELVLTDAVIFTGSIPHETTLEYLAHAEAFVLNTAYEGLSHTILEAFALRIPVLTTPAGGNTELVEDGVTGILFTVDDIPTMVASILRIQDNEQLRSFLTTHARVRLEDFSQERMLQGILKVLSV